ncbi:MAG: general secretion pathway protein GspK [Candidatus Omnitrophica bacterium]|nr:general secretion pathway protein GspK [Candidatus Omnitrophota bacterium]
MKRCNKDNKGIILVIVLWVLFFLSVTALTLGMQNRLNIRLQSLTNEKARMLYLSRESVNRIIILLAKDDPSFDAFSEEWSTGVSLQNEEGITLCEVNDEDRCLNINTAPVELIERIKLIFPGLGEEEIKLIANLRPFNVKKELLDLAQIDREIFYGNPSEGKIGMQDMITVFSDGKININTAPKEVLMILPNMNEGVVDTILSHRQVTPFNSNETLSEGLSLLGLTPEQVGSLIKICKVQSSIFSVKVNSASKRKHVSKGLELIFKRVENKFNVLLAKEN